MKLKRPNSEYMVTFENFEGGFELKFFKDRKSAEKFCSKNALDECDDAIEYEINRVTHEVLIDTLEMLFEREHGGCDDTTCDMTVAFDAGYSLWAIYLFSSSGATSDEFNELYERLNKKRFERDARKECNEFVKECPSTECHHCNSYIYHYEANQTHFHCSNCGKSFEVNDLRSIVQRTLRQNKIAV